MRGERLVTKWLQTSRHGAPAGNLSPVEAASVTAAPAAPPATGLRRTRRLYDRLGDRGLIVLTGIAAVFSVATVGMIIWQVIAKAWPAVRHYNISFLWHSTWNPVTDVYGAREYIVGTLVTSFGAVLIAAPLSIAIGLFLSELAPPAIRGPIGSLVDMLAAVPSVVIGLWGIYVLLPVVHNNIEPFLHSTVGWIPIFGSPQAAGLFPAVLVLAIMATPITSSICRELFVSVPGDLEEAAFGLGATRWEMVRGVVIPSVKGGVVAAVVLGLGRALGEAIAVTQVIGNGVPIRLNIFAPATTIASQLANQYSSQISPLFVSSLIYLGMILMVITFTTNLIAQRIVHRFERQRTN
jgi:phosphate transport system permease protein